MLPQPSPHLWPNWSGKRTATLYTHATCTCCAMDAVILCRISQGSCAHNSEQQRCAIMPTCASHTPHCQPQLFLCAVTSTSIPPESFLSHTDSTGSTDSTDSSTATATGNNNRQQQKDQHEQQVGLTPQWPVVTAL